MKYQAVIGLEVHVQVNTKTKMFCSCSTEFGLEPNKNTCPVCLGMPGTLPVINQKAMEMGAKASLAINSEIQPYNRFARKNYFYPDLPKGYQISQYDLPLAQGGYVDIKLNGVSKRINITRLHMEEDAGKLIHGVDGDECSYVDLNRAGIPLMEIVSEPDISSADEAKEYMVRLKEILEYIDVSDCNMEEGSLRCDANISVMPVNSKVLGTRAEIKNMNSFRFLHKAIEYEIERQISLLEDGEKIVQETRLFDSVKGITASMRSKEEAHDYRYFPDPDLLPMKVESGWIDEIRKTLPELPDAKRKRFESDYGLPEYDAGVLSSSISLSTYFENTLSNFNNPKIVSNWVMGEVLRFIKEGDLQISEFSVTPDKLAGLLLLVDKGTISGKIAKTVFEEMTKEGKKAEDVVKEKGLVQISGEEDILGLIEEVLKGNPKEVLSYKEGKIKLFGFLVGQIMKVSRGKANPSLVNKLLKEKLSQDPENVA